MLPFSFEWVWDSGHILFHGALWFALNVIGIGMTFVIGKSVYDTFKGKNSQSHEQSHH